MDLIVLILPTVNVDLEGEWGQIFPCIYRMLKYQTCLFQMFINKSWNMKKIKKNYCSHTKCTTEWNYNGKNVQLKFLTFENF